MRIAFILVAVCFISSLRAQTVRTISNACGDTYTSGTIGLRTSVGEPVVGMQSTTSGYLSQGFFQARPPKNIIPVPATGYSLYPNPFTGELMVQGDVTKVKLVQLFDMAGRLIISSPLNSNLINVKSISPGVYTARMTGENNTVIYYKKIVKQ